MNKKEIYTKIARLIYDLLGVDIDEEEPDATLADLDMDSLDAVELAFDLEEAFDIEILDMEICRKYGDMTVKDLVEYVAKMMEG